LEILHRAAPCRNVPVTFTLCLCPLKCRWHSKRSLGLVCRARLNAPAPLVSQRAHVQPLERVSVRLPWVIKRSRWPCAPTERSEALCGCWQASSSIVPCARIAPLTSTVPVSRGRALRNGPGITDRSRPTPSGKAPRSAVVNHAPRGALPLAAAHLYVRRHGNLLQLPSTVGCTSRPVPVLRNYGDIALVSCAGRQH
jgi:hypothetical protein